MLKAGYLDEVLPGRWFKGTNELLSGYKGDKCSFSLFYMPAWH